PATIRSYYSNAGQFVAWCVEHGINLATATEDDIAAYRKGLVAKYATGTVAVKLAAIRRLHEAAVWRGLRHDNLTETSAVALRQWLDIRESVDNPGEPTLFVSLDRAHRSGGMSVRAIRHLVDGYLEALDLKVRGVSCHSLRHSAAPEESGDDVEASYQLGQ
ncbi:MAG: site-specific integrase, partial [Anaerolineae bacterium]|nr:site-specific integrase [Anaerolineae bacterium]